MEEIVQSYPVPGDRRVSGINEGEVDGLLKYQITENLGLSAGTVQDVILTEKLCRVHSLTRHGQSDVVGLQTPNEDILGEGLHLAHILNDGLSLLILQFVVESVTVDLVQDLVVHSSVDLQLLVDEYIRVKVEAAVEDVVSSKSLVGVGESEVGAADGVDFAVVSRHLQVDGSEATLEDQPWQDDLVTSQFEGVVVEVVERDGVSTSVKTRVEIVEVREDAVSAEF